MSQLERLQYHLVFATKYRYRMLSVSVAADTESILYLYLVAKTK